MILILDTETTGLPANMNAPHTDTENWPHMLSVAWEVYQDSGEFLRKENYIVAPRFGVVNNAVHINGITPEIQEREGVHIDGILEDLFWEIGKSARVVAHNAQFDAGIIGAEFERNGWGRGVEILGIGGESWFCTKEDIGNLLQLPPTEAQLKYRPEIEYKQPKLDELYQFLFGKPVPGREESHGARQDAAACAKCYWELKRRNLI